MTTASKASKMSLVHTYYALMAMAAGLPGLILFFVLWYLE